MKVTREEVAKHAGVSPATVSYVLNNSRNVSEETRKRVLEAVEKMNYKPDLIARSMVTKETKQLSIILNDIANPFFSEIILAFENAAIERGYFVNICTGYKNIDDYFDHFISRRIDGICVLAIPNKFHMDKIYDLVDKGIKVVVSGNAEADIKRVSLIENDYINAMDQAIRYLMELGHREIAYVSGLSSSQKFDRRIEGYLKALKKYNLSCGDRLLIEGKAPYNTTIMDGYYITKELISTGKFFTAVICTNDLMAVGAMRALQEAGYSVPDDVSVMGFDDIFLSDIWQPPLTTMSVPKTLLGTKAFELLYGNIKKGNTGFYMTKPELVVRKSTDVCKHTSRSKQ
ncbi:MAG: LacI family transcriptional regulator [Clostridiales bacterium]|nr:LacI family transcriptional regulator [Clostridiales bacterium]